MARLLSSAHAAVLSLMAVRTESSAYQLHPSKGSSVFRPAGGDIAAAIDVIH